MSASPTASTEVENSVGTGNIMLKACSWFASHSVACLWGKAVRHYRRCTKSSGSSCEVFANPQSLGRHFPKSWPRLHSHKDVLFISPLCWLDCCQRSRRYSHGLLENVYFPKISAVNSHTVHLSFFTLYKDSLHLAIAIFYCSLLSTTIVFLNLYCPPHRITWQCMFYNYPWLLPLWSIMAL